MLTLGILQNIGGWEWMVILVIGLLLFGRRLPEVGRSLGKGIVEFKKGLKGIDDEIETQSSKPSAATTSGTSRLSEPAPATRLDPPRGPAGEEVRVSRSDSVE